jgi:hypothetical protein
MMQMGAMGKKKNKPVQYVVGGSVAVVILGFWISMPLMSGGSGFSSFSSGNPFNSKVANISTLGTSDRSQSGAVLSGEMISNPATSGEDILSSLFQSGPSEDPVEVAADGAADAEASAAAPSPGGYGGDVPAPSGGRAMGKLAAVPSIGGGGGGTMTGSSSHNKFFGSAGAQKAEFSASLGGPDMKKMVAEPGKKGGQLSSLNSAMENSRNALKTPDLGATRGSAAAAFTGGGKGGALDSLNKTAEKSEEGSIGLDDGASTTANLKRSDPNISKRKVAPPAVNAAEEVKDPNEEYKQMITKMLIQAAFGIVFGGGFGGGPAGGGAS